MGTIRGLLTLVLLLSFLGLVIRLVMSKDSEVYRAAGRLPLEDDASIDSRSTHS